jgi:outer membrane protein TolC
MDALLAMAREEEAKAALAVARANVEAARTSFAALLGRPVPATTVFRVSEPTQSEVDRALGAVVAPVRDPLHDVANAELARARALDESARSEHLPKLVVAGSAGYARRAAPEDPGYWAAGVGIVVPLLSFVGEAARAREADASAKGAAARALQADNELRSELARETASLRAFASSVSSAEASFVAAKTALDAAEARYGAGQLSFAEADAARDAFVRIASARRRLGLEAALALARLRTWSARPGESMPRP